MAFPDTNAHSGQEAIDSYFCFRFRCQLMSDFDQNDDSDDNNNNNTGNYNNNSDNDSDSEDKIVSKLSKMSQKEKELYFEGISHRKMYNDSYLFGFAYFRQRKDDSIERGFFQQSIVIVTPLPYISVFKQCMETIGPLYFEHGMNIIDSACRNVLLWPTPATRGNVSLPLLGAIINVILSPHIVPMSAAITNKHKKYQKELKRQQREKERRQQQQPREPPPPPPSQRPPSAPQSGKSASASNILEEIGNARGAAELLSNWSTHPDGGCFQEVKCFEIVL